MTSIHKLANGRFEQRCSLPWLTLTLAAIAVVGQSDGDLGRYLAYDRTAIKAGEFWRLVTGHLAHWNADHLLWDVAMFATLGVILERRDCTSFTLAIIASIMAISAALWFGHPAINQYRGLSGIDSALFTHAAIRLTIEAWRTRRQMVCGLALFAVVGFTAKIVYELVSGNTFFVDSADAGFVPLPAVHVIGGLVGALCSGEMVFLVHGRPVHNFAPRSDRMCATTSRISS
jgi:rhomboid family GlyGly-CTERM serine protease